MRGAVWALAGLLGIFAPAVARATPQGSAPPQLGPGAHAEPPVGVAAPSGYPVTGRVICADTQRPARFAMVNLIPSGSGDGATHGGFDMGRRSGARTDLDGHFAINNVQPGDYYVTAALTGYVNDAQAVERAVSGGEAVPPGLNAPRIHVSTGGAAVELSLDRGAVIAGTATWDDGSPASGIQISTQTAPASGVQGGSATQDQTIGRTVFLFGAGAQTDDRGRFRLTGLSPGSYVVRATLQAPLPPGPDDRGYSPLSMLAVYAPGRMRRTEAAVISLTAGEERDDLAITLALAGLHTISGAVSSPGAAVRSGSVSLSDQTDASLSRMGRIGSDGSFVIPYVPPGNYTLTVNASSLASGSFGRDPASSPGVRFQPLQTSVTVTDSDVTGLSLNVTPATASP